MKLKEIKKRLEGYKLEKYLGYNKIPIIYFEASCLGEVKNPFIKELGIDHGPTKVFLLDKILEGWQNNPKWIIIKDKNRINKIINRGLDFIKKNKKQFEESLSKKKFTNKELIELLNEVNRLVEEVYNSFVFFADECFETEDQELINKLPKIRWELSDFIDIYAWKAYENILKNISRNLGVARKIVDNATTKELIAVLSGESNFKELGVNEKRKFGMALIDGEEHYFFNDQIEEIRMYLDEKDPLIKLINKAKEEKQIKGMVAQKGVVKGEVIKLLEKDYNNAEKILRGKKNYILVTPMTRPEIVKYMKAAAGFITDEGGLTCHAAIVAREMKKPCVIGTKISTRVLDSGMEVEINGDEGVVNF
jgi:phosphohistidine swiveling domain-containing protein